MNLLKITTTPMKINVVVEKSKFEEVKQVSIPTVPLSRKSNGSALKANKQAVSAKRDVYRPTNTAKQSVEHIPLKISAVNGMSVESVQTNQQTQNLSTVLQQRFSSEASNVAYIPVSNTGEVKWEPHSMQLEFQPMQIDLGQLQKQYKFVPSQLKFEIEQYPSIQIEYLGDPVYAPPSANPNYREEE